MESGNLNFLEPSGPLQVCKGTALPFITIKPKFKNLVQLEVFIHVISYQFTNCGNMYTFFMVVVVSAAVALVITLERHVWHYARDICLTWCCLNSVHFLLISHGCVKSTLVCSEPKIQLTDWLASSIHPHLRTHTSQS